MNNIITKSLLFIGGGVIGFLAAKTIYTGYYEKLIETEIASVKDAYETHISMEKKTNAIIKEMDNQKEEIQNRKIQNNLCRNSDENTNQYNSVKRNYGLVKDEEIDEQYLNDTAYGEPVTDTYNPVPYIITEESFNQDFDHHDKISTDFYIDDNVMVDEDDIGISEEETIKLIGEAAFTVLCNVKSDTIIHVRNEKLKIDYEIGTVDDSYKATKEYEQGVAEERKQIKNLTPREAFEARQKKGSDLNGKAR